MRDKLLLVCRMVYKKFSGYRMRRFYFFRILKEFIVSLLRKDYAEVDGHKMFLDPKDTFCLSIFGTYEPFQTEIVKEKIKKGDVVLDIGANIGYYTLIFARLVGENGRVYAFEPNPENFKLLEKNVKINGYKNVILVPKAVSNVNEKIQLNLSKDIGSHSIVYSPGGSNAIAVEAVSLDDYFKAYAGKVDFIKMDIEGAEGLALKGMPLLLSRNKNLKIIMEFRPMIIKASNINAEELLTSLVKNEFEIFDINERVKKIELTSVRQIMEKYSPEEDIHTNLLCVKKQ